MSADDLGRIRSEVTDRGARYGGNDLEGAMIDCDHALFEAGFTSPEVLETDEIEAMLVFRCQPAWAAVRSDEVIERLEQGWMQWGAFANEAHTITVETDKVALEFVTWWDGGAFCTGRIEVALGDQPSPPKDPTSPEG
jgi:hypothetical protein